MEHVRTIELDGRGQEKESPLASRCVTNPHWFHQKDFGGVAIFNKTHEDDTDHKSRYADNGSKYKSPEKGTLFSGLHRLGTFFEGGRMMDRDFKRR